MKNVIKQIPNQNEQKINFKMEKLGKYCLNQEIKINIIGYGTSRNYVPPVKVQEYNINITLNVNCNF